MKNINLNNQLPAFCRVILHKFCPEDMHTLFRNSLSDEDKKKVNTYLNFVCSDDCGAKIDLAYHGLNHYFPGQGDQDSTINFTPAYGLDKFKDSADNICVDFVKNPNVMEEFNDFFWTVKNAQKFKTDLTENLWCLLEFHTGHGNNGFSVIVRSEGEKVQFFLFEIPDTIPVIPVLEESTNPKHCLGLIHETTGDANTLKQGDCNEKNPLLAGVYEWAQKMFLENGIGKQEIFLWTRKYKYVLSGQTADLPF